MSNDVEPALQAFADEAVSIESRVRAVSFRPGDQRAVMLLDVFDAPREATLRLYERLKTYREVNGVECDVLITNSTTAAFVTRPDIPGGWPPT